MDPFQERLEKAKALGRDIRRLEQGKAQVENEMQRDPRNEETQSWGKEMLARITELLKQCWIEKDKLD